MWQAGQLWKGPPMERHFVEREATCNLRQQRKFQTIMCFCFHLSLVDVRCHLKVFLMLFLALERVNSSVFLLTLKWDFSVLSSLSHMLNVKWPQLLRVPQLVELLTYCKHQWHLKTNSVTEAWNEEQSLLTEMQDGGWMDVFLGSLRLA